MITDPAKIEQFFVRRKKGFYLSKAKIEYENGWAFDGAKANYADVDNAKFLAFDPKSDESLYYHVKSMIGEWTIKTADEWRKYIVIDTTGKEDELYGW